MIRPSGFTIAVLVLAAAVVVASVDLFRLERVTLVVYATPALRDLLESFIAPQFRAVSGVDVTPVYLSAGEQYNRLIMSGGHPEADVFLHASPLYLEQGFGAGYFLPVNVSRDAAIPAEFKSRNVTGGRLWYAFAWSPLVEVYNTRINAPPDLASINTTFGFPHPLLSNNGVYAVLFFNSLSPAAGVDALAHTVVQPVNARANILGVVEGDFDLTLGYEAVLLFYTNQGVRVGSSLPVLGNQSYVTPVVFSAGLVNGHPNPQASAFIEFLFNDTIQTNLSRFYFRSVLFAPPPAGAMTLYYDWSQWRGLEQVLPSYVVGG